MLDLHLSERTRDYFGADGIREPRCMGGCFIHRHQLRMDSFFLFLDPVFLQTSEKRKKQSELSEIALLL